MTDYHRGDVVFANDCIWLWVQPNGQAGEWVNSYGQKCSAEGIDYYGPQLLIRDNMWQGGVS